MKELQNRVKKELENIGEKGLTASNLETTNKLVDIYKDLVEICEKESRGEKGMYDRYYDDDRYDARGRDSRGRYTGDYGYHSNDKFNRYLTRMNDGMEDYYAGRARYRDGGSNERMVEGIEMTMGAIVNFIESLMDIAETQQEKEIVRKYVEKIRKV